MSRDYYTINDNTPDDDPQFVLRRDVSGGINTRQHASHIGENQVTALYNVDIGVLGERTKRKGLTLAENLGTSVGLCLFGFEPDGGTNELLAVEDTNLSGYVGSGTFTTYDTGFSSGLLTNIIQTFKSGGDGHVAMIQNGTDNPHEMKQDHTVTDLGTGNTAPPKSLANLFFRGRWFILKDNELFYSSAYPTDYSTSFDQNTNAYKIPCGKERALVGLRDSGIVCVGSQSIWAINPSTVPHPTDRAELLLDKGTIANKTVCLVNDDVYFLAPDGVRGLFRTIQDKVQLGTDFPLSFPLKDRYDLINWSYINKASAVFFDNKYFIALPTESSTYNNEVWVYYPALRSWMVITGWNVADWAKVKFDGEEKLFAIDSTNGKVYRAWYGYSDNGTAINYQEESREEDLGSPLNYKSGGQIEVVAKVSGDYDISVYANFDNTGYSLLGTINLSGDLVTFPVTFPVEFAESGLVKEIFHIDSQGRWKNVKIKIQHNELNGNDDITIIEHAIVSFLEKYLT